MSVEDELSVKLMIAEARIIALERELALFTHRAGKAAPAPRTPRQVRAATLLSVRQAHVIALTDGKCFYCDCDLTVQTMTEDHLIPVSKGGGNGQKNIVPACSACNNKKGNRMPCTQEVERAAYLRIQLKRFSGLPNKVVQVRHWRHWHKEKDWEPKLGVPAA